jgi:tetratricopeptide (TPR) repeat protein
VQTRLGALLHATSRRPEGRRWLETAVAAVQANAALDSANLALPVFRNWGVSLLADGRLELAEEVLEKDVELRRREYPGTTLLAAALRDLSRAQMALGRDKQAQITLAESFAIWRTATSNQAEPGAANGFFLVGAELSLALGDGPAVLEQLLKMVPPAHRHVALPLDEAAAGLLRSRAYRMSGRVEEADQAATAVVDLLRHARDRAYYQWLEADALMQLGQAQRLAGRPGIARTNLEQAIELGAANDAAASPWLAEARMALAEDLIDLGDRHAAEHLRAQAAAALAIHREIGDHFTQALHALSVRLET